MGNNLQILLCLADLESPGAGRGVAMNVRPLFAGLGVAAGGAAAIFYLQLREIVDHSWGWYPAEEVHSLTWATGASLLICLLALLIATWPEKNPERVEG